MRMLAAATAGLRRLLDVLLIALIVAVLLGILLAKLVPLTGRQTIIVGGSSMEPAIALGAAIVIRPVPETRSVSATWSRSGPATSRRSSPTGSSRSSIGRTGAGSGPRATRTRAPDPTLVHASAVDGSVRAGDPARGLPARPPVDPHRRPVPRRPRRQPAGRCLAARVPGAGAGGAGQRVIPARHRTEPAASRSRVRRNATFDAGRRRTRRDRRPLERGGAARRRPNRSAAAAAARRNAPAGAAPTALRCGTCVSASPLRRIPRRGARHGRDRGANPRPLHRPGHVDGQFLDGHPRPPTNLAATPVGLTANLTWVPSTDAYAAGLRDLAKHDERQGLRACRDSVTPGSASSASDAPGIGIFYYVLRSTFQNWHSVDSNETSATSRLGPVSTGQKGCRRRARPTRAATATATRRRRPARAPTTPRWRQMRAPGPQAAHELRERRPTTATASATSASGCRAARPHRRHRGPLDAGMNNNGGTSRLCVELSWNGGATGRPPRSSCSIATAETTSCSAVRPTPGAGSGRLRN